MPKKRKPITSPFTIRETSRNVHVVTLDPKRKEWFFLLMSDIHLDNPNCLREKFFEHLERGAALGAGVILNGDTMCLMQCRGDRRGEHGAKLHRDEVPAYVDSVIKGTADELAEYAQSIMVIGRGNHEQAIVKYCNTDPTVRLAERLSAITGHKVHHGGYGGWLRFKGTQSTQRDSLLLRYFHGSGGGAPVTKGSIQLQRMAVRHPQADVIHMGHVHNRVTVSHEQDCLSSGNQSYKRELRCIITPGYQDSYKDGYSGWSVESGHDPKPSGCTLMRIYWTPDKRSTRSRMACEFTDWG